MLHGLVLGATTVSGIGSSNVLSSGPAEAFLAYFPLLIPALVIVLPILDAVFAVIRRVRKHRSVFHADKEHLHHRLMDLGHGHRQAVIVMYAWSALAAGAALAFTFWGNRLVFALPIAVAAIVVYTLFPLLTKVIQDKLSL
jgi:UDP-GlcNAc:undecaprenyl-phosphate GlcNAc-1-phosphate transferase